MDDHAALDQLEALAFRLGIQLRYEKIKDEDVTSSGGLCRFRGKDVLVIHSRATTKEKIKVLVEALKKYDLDDVYIRPAVRELLER